MNNVSRLLKLLDYTNLESKVRFGIDVVREISSGEFFLKWLGLGTLRATKLAKSIIVPIF